MNKSLLTIAVTLVLTSGCSMCCGPFDYDYPAFGGKHPRANRSHGRVGSILSDPMRSLGGPLADSNLAAPPEQISTKLDEDDGDGLDGPDIDLDSPRAPNRSLEGIEPLRGSETTPSEDIPNADNTTASSRWRPRSLRSAVR